MTLDEDHRLARRTEQGEARLALLPIGYPSADGLGFLAHDLSLSGIKTTLAQNQDIESAAYTPSRGQYRADVLLDQARRAVSGRVLAVTDADLYVPDLNFVFGMADHSHRAAVSMHRLRLGAGAALLRARLFKEALHEIGHTFGLAHCFDTRCVMSFSNSLSEVDRKSRQFCRTCREKLAVRMANAARGR
jgi:archaemetzincin